MTGYDKVQEAAERLGLVASHKWGAGFTAHCPGPLHVNGDRKASLSVDEGEQGRALVYCFAGCDPKDIMEGLGLTEQDMFSDEETVEYVYTDEDGKPLYMMLREPGKKFTWMRHEDGGWAAGLGETKRVLYNLPAVLTAETVYLCEGEKDAETANSLGAVGTTAGGAGFWRPEFTSILLGKKVYLVGDNDEPGRAHVAKVSRSLEEAGVDVTVTWPREGKDLTDHVEKGYSLAQLVTEEDVEEFDPLDWQTYETPDTDWILEPYVPRQGRCLAFGASGSLKTQFALWLATRVAKQGGKVAFFELEMLPSEVTRRLKRLNPPRENFLLLTKLRMGSPDHLRRILRGLKGYDLIVVDSWNAAHNTKSYSADEIAELDNEFFQPLVRETGATLLILDNTGKSVLTESGPVEQDDPRGSSGKVDKMDVAFKFRRPWHDNNYVTEITMRKMRYDHHWPPALTVEAPSDDDEFYVIDENGSRGHLLWPTSITERASVSNTNGATKSSDQQPSGVGDADTASSTDATVRAEEDSTGGVPPAEMTLSEKLAFARLKDMLGMEEINDETEAS